MESNECICYDLMMRLQSMINTLLTTTANTAMNTNTPASDSGYSQTQNLEIGRTNNFLNLNTIFYSGLIIAALILYLSRGARRVKTGC